MKKYLYSLTFTKKYLFALSIIAFFSVSAYFNLSRLIDIQNNDAKVINISGKQRMLSQKIALFAVSYRVKELQEITAEMSLAHKYLLSLPMNTEIKNTYFSKPTMLDKKVQEYIKNSRNFIETRSGRALSYMLKNSQVLLKDLDMVVSLYQKEAESRTKILKQNELYIVIFILITLVLEAIFIFRPANNRILEHTKRLKLQKKYSDMVTQTNTNAIIAVDETFTILTFNKSAQIMFGYSEEEMLHTKLIDDRIIPLKYLKAHNLGLANFAKNGVLKNLNTVFELKGQTKDKTIFPIKISFGINIEEDSKIVVANIQNISKEKETDELMLLQSRSAAMGEMISNIAHQWRQPLSSISTLATGAKLRYKNNMITAEELDTTFIKIKEHTQHLSKTIDDFRDFFKEDKESELFDVYDVVTKSIMLTEAAYKSSNIKLIFDERSEHIEIDGSSSELSQVVINILNNAKDALESKESKVVIINIKQYDKHVVISIQDSAGGVPEDIKTKIFDPYFTTKHKAQGTGIGLFMSKKIINQHFNGDIRVENREFFDTDRVEFGAEFSIRVKNI